MRESRKTVKKNIALIQLKILKIELQQIKVISKRTKESIDQELSILEEDIRKI